MFKLYSMEKAKRIVSDQSDLIESICAPYRLPSACLKAILLMEIPEIDLTDLFADTIVWLNWLRYSLTHRYNPERHTQNPLRKFDSSTGYGQIFSRVAIEAILFARSRGIPVDAGISGELSPVRPEDLRRVWLRLNHEPVFNLNCSALNLLHAAFQMTGRVRLRGKGLPILSELFVTAADIPDWFNGILLLPRKAGGKQCGNAD